MPRVAPHAPVYLTDPQGTCWRVYDHHHVHPGGPEPPARSVPPGSDPRAAHRLFVREGDRLVFGMALMRDDRADLSPAALAAQLLHALAVGPSMAHNRGDWRALFDHWLAHDPSRRLVMPELPEPAPCPPGCPTCDTGGTT
jgi:hypothetical protein